MTFKRFLVWYGLLHKRLLKKIGFLLILLAIPVTALLWARLGGEEQGLIRVAAAPETVWEDAALAAVERMEGSSLISVLPCESAAQAQALVASGDAETAWIFQPKLEENLRLAGQGKSVTLVRVLLQEENVFGAAVREKLYGALFGEISYAMFENFIREELPGNETVAEETLRGIYEDYEYPQGLVDYVFLDGGENPLDNASMLLSPLRGLLSVLLFLSGMAAALYAKADERRQVFAMLPPRRRVLPMLLTVWSAVSVTALFVFGALLLSGVAGQPGREALRLGLLALSVTGLCALLAAVLPGEGALGAALPLVLVASLVFCPVFVNLRTVPAVSALLPPWYYLFDYPLGAAAYAAVTLTAAYFLYPRLRGK